MGEVEGWKIGCGIAVGGLVGSTAPASAACRLERDGSCSIIVGGVDLTGSDLSLALIAAEELHVPVSSINVIHNNTDALPYIAGTGGSKGIYSIGPAVIEAACDAYRQMLAIAGVMLEAAVEDLEISNGKVVVRGADKSLPLTEIAEASIYQVRQFEPVYGQGRAANKDVAPIFAAHMARVAVHPETGEVRVLDYIVAQDVGCAINPAEIEGQIHGSVAQGIGWALLEGFCYDEQGQLLTSTLMDYALPRCEDVPTITTVLVEVPSTSGPFGAKGVAEPSVVPVGAAIANAIYDAVGVRIRQLPITAEHLFMAMHDLNERSFS